MCPGSKAVHQKKYGLYVQDMNDVQGKKIQDVSGLLGTFIFNHFKMLGYLWKKEKVDLFLKVGFEPFIYYIIANKLIVVFIIIGSRYLFG